MKKKAAIVGAGLMGTAMTWPLSDNGHEVSLIGTHLDGEIIQSCKDSGFHPRLRRQLPEQVTPFFIEEIETALNGADIIVSGVSSAGARWIGQAIGPIIKPESKVITITKGLESNDNGELIILPEVMRSEFPREIRDGVSIAAVGGPRIAGELAGRRQSCVYLGCLEIETALFFADIFRTDYYHIFTTNDIVGLEIAVALKNAYALGVGLANGLLKKQNGPDQAGAYMHNMAAALFAQACIEIKIVLECMQANSDFAFNLPGAGDLFVTSQAGRSVTLGSLLGEGKSYPKALEELAGETLESAMVIKKMGQAIPMMEKSGLINGDKLPFMKLLIDLILHEKPLEIQLDHFFSDVII